MLPAVTALVERAVGAAAVVVVVAADVDVVDEVDDVNDAAAQVVSVDRYSVR